MHQPYPTPGPAAQRPAWLAMPRAVALGLALACILGSLIYGLRDTAANGVSCGSAWSPDQGPAKKAHGEQYLQVMQTRIITPPIAWERDCGAAAAEHETPALALGIIGGCLLLGALGAPRRW